MLAWTGHGGWADGGKVAAMSLLAESNIWREVKDLRKDMNGWAAALHEEQKRTNELLEQLLQAMQGQPRQLYPGPIQQPR